MNSGSPNFTQVVAALKANNLRKAVELFDLGEALKKFTKNVVEVVNGVVVYNGKPVHHVVASRILEYMSAKKPAKYLIKFLENLLANTDPKVQEQLFPFLEHRNIPISDDGCIIAYKSIRDNWKDWWTNTLDNSIGKTVQMPREEVTSDPNIHCGPGLYAGSHIFCYDYHKGDSRHLVAVKINPADVVSIPNDANCQKMRSCKYTVVEEIFITENPLSEVLYKVNDNNCGFKTKKTPQRDSYGRFCK
jgi:hypothetical protein